MRTSYYINKIQTTTTDKASINYAGKVTAKKPGTVRVKASCTGITNTATKTVTIEQSYEGTYYFKNAEHGKYMQIENTSPITASGRKFELWEFNRSIDQKWSIDYVGDGYYKIISAASEKAITAPASLNDQLRQYVYNGSVEQQWKISKIDGMYKFSPRSSPSNFMSAGEGVFTSNGRDIRLMQNQSDNSDEWVIEKIKDKAIIIIPGITCGSLQNESGAKIWLYVGRQNQLACDENGKSINNISPYNPDNYGILDMYKDVFNTLSSEYGDEYDVLFFAYDWRMTCADVAVKLEELTDYYDNCIFIAHSMGGIVASSYLANSANNRAKIEKLITIGTPFTGAPKALYVMETGRLHWITEAALNLSEYAKNIPALYELFPTKSYFNKYTRFINVNGVNKSGYSEAWNFMKTLNWAKKSNGEIKPMFNEAELFHNTLYIDGTHVVERSDVDTYKIIGVEEDTITCVAFDANNNYDFYYYTSEGDGTVPAYSALNNVDMYSYKTYAFRKNHTDLIKYEGCIQLIIDIINEEPYVYYDSTISSTIIPFVEEKITATNDNIKVDERITVVAKNIDSMQIYYAGKFLIYSVGEKLFFEDENGVEHRAGSIWLLGDNSYQYVLFNSDYVITNIKTINSNSSIRMDYCNYGLSENAILNNNIKLNDVIYINKYDRQISLNDGITIRHSYSNSTE